jgi:hypothetical protein
MTHSPGKIEYNCRYFIMTFRTQIHKIKFGKNCFCTLQGTMSHRPLTNTSSLKIAAAYWRYSKSGWYFGPGFVNYCPLTWLTSPLPPPPFPKSTYSVYRQCVAGRGWGCVELCWRPYSAGVYHPVSDQTKNLQNCYTTPKKPRRGRRPQTDKHLPHSPFTSQFFR